MRMLKIAKEIASEHVQVMTADLQTGSSPT